MRSQISLEAEALGYAGLCKSATECLKFAFHLSVEVERWRSLNKLSCIYLATFN